MEITYGSVCSGIEAATLAWKPLGRQRQWKRGQIYFRAGCQLIQANLFDGSSQHSKVSSPEIGLHLFQD
jgi:hypothetical protein